MLKHVSTTYIFQLLHAAGLRNLRLKAWWSAAMLGLETRNRRRAEGWGNSGFLAIQQQEDPRGDAGKGPVDASKISCRSDQDSSVCLMLRWSDGILSLPNWGRHLSESAYVFWTWIPISMASGVNLSKQHIRKVPAGLCSAQDHGAGSVSLKHWLSSWTAERAA